MQINTTARHCDLDPEVRLFAQQRLEKFERFARDILEAHLIVSAEITLKLKRREIVSREESTEPRSAIDLAATRLETQLRRLKEKRVSRKRSGPMPNGMAQVGFPGKRETALEIDGEGIAED